MSEEMRVALVGVAMGAGLAFEEAWDVVDGLDDDHGRDGRKLAAVVAERARAVAFPH